MPTTQDNLSFSDALPFEGYKVLDRSKSLHLTATYAELTDNVNAIKNRIRSKLNSINSAINDSSSNNRFKTINQTLNAPPLDFWLCYAFCQYRVSDPIFGGFSSGDLSMKLVRNNANPNLLLKGTIRINNAVALVR